MGKLRIRRNKEKNMIWKGVKFYIDFFVLICCLIVVFNIHPTNNLQNETQDSNTLEKPKMIYIFHDYEWNEYILNDTIHGAASDWSYLFEDDIPEDLKWDEELNEKLDENDIVDSVSLGWIDQQDTIDINDTELEEDNSQTVKDNQISSQEIFTDLWIKESDLWNEYYIDTWNEDNSLIINLSNTWTYITKYQENDDYYIILEDTWDNNDNTLVIKKLDNSNNNSNNIDKSKLDNGESVWSAKIFSFTLEGWVLPILIPWDELQFNNGGTEPVGYIDNSWSVYWINSFDNGLEVKKPGITIIDDYADCMTPWWYKIVHWDSVLAYKQMKDTPDFCHIERRFCRNGKLSWTYTQQWCSINKNYTYETWWEVTVQHKEEENKSNVIQNSDWSVTVNKPLWTWSFVFDRPSQTSTPEYHISDNVRNEEEVEQTKRSHWDCKAPWWEEVKHWQFVQAFKHSNWFSDAPCIAQIRLCSMGDLMWTYTQSSCKTWDTSLIDRINWSPTRDSFSEEKLEWIRKQIETEEKRYNKNRKNAKEIVNINAPIDDILSLLDGN